MKKRLLSLALCLALCLGLLPVGVLAEELVPSENDNTTTVASVTVGSTTTNYSDIKAALDAAQKSEGCLLKLESDISSEQLYIYEGNFTLDLNGKTLSSADTNTLVVRFSTSLTIQDSVGTGKIENIDTQNNGAAVWCDCTSVTIKSGTVTSSSDHALYWDTGDIHIEGGTFSSLKVYPSTSADPWSRALADGKALAKNNAIVNADTTSLSQGPYTVVDHTHSSYTSGKCTECGKECPHLNFNENKICTTCGVQAVASITKGEDVTYYGNLSTAINNANGETVTLLADLDVGNVNIDGKNLTLDLNGKTLRSNQSNTKILSASNAVVTIKNGTIESTQNDTTAIYAGFETHLTLEDIVVTASGSSSTGVMLSGGGGSTATIKSGTYQGLYVGEHMNVTLEGGTFNPCSDQYSIFRKVDASCSKTSRDCMELLGAGYSYVDASNNPVRTFGGFNQTVTVTKNVEIPSTPVAKVGETEYPSLREAIAAAKNGSTITLLHDLDLGNGAMLLENSGSFTLDLNQHRLHASGSDYLVFVRFHRGNVSLINGTLDGSACSSTYGAISVYGANFTMTLNNITAVGGTVTNWTNQKIAIPVIVSMNGSTVVFDGGVYTGGIQISNNGSNAGNIVLKSGTFRKGENTYSIKTEVNDKYLSDYLDDDSQFWNDNTLLDLSNKTQTADEVTVRPCKHNWENGKCTVCQKVCDHGSADGKSMTEDPCPTCGMKAAAQVDITGSDAKYFPSFTDALVYATKNNGCTLKLLADVPLPEGTTLAIVKPLILDLNGHSIDRLSVSATVKIRDSGTTRGKIGALTVSNMMDADGNETDLTLGDLLEEGYAFKYENGYWADDSHKETISGLDVTVEKAPIQSVEVYAKDKKNKEVPTNMAYGTTGEVTLVSSCRMGETSGADLTYLWYKLEGAAATAPLEGATGANYTLPDNLAAGTHTYLLICTSDGYSKSKEITITVNKATPTGKPEYTAITTSGKKLSDASLTQTETSFSVPGTVAWKLPADTEVTANTAYTWKFTPQDEQNYNDLTGTITLWHKSSSGGSSGAVTPGTKTDTVKNPDGSTTKTETKADGSKTETTTASSGGGSTGITVTKTDAKGNTTTEASAKLSDRDVKEAQEKDEAVSVPVKGIAAAKDANAATKIKIDVPNNANKTTVEIPVENVTSGTVAVIVHEDGTEELVKDSKPTEHGVQLELSGSTTVKIIDNSKTFDDTKDHWSRDEVNFVAARELFNGVGGNQFGVSQPMTRGMVNTVLARLADVDTTPGQGQAWYEVGTDWAKKNGISDGTNPTAPVTREQLATLLYRYAGSPSVSGTLHAADAASVSDYAEDALLWANQNGIVNGVGSNTIAPKDNAQRAQVAAMLARYLQNQ